VDQAAEAADEVALLSPERFAAGEEVEASGRS
jgi:hypothetical protein